MKFMTLCIVLCMSFRVTGNIPVFAADSRAVLCCLTHVCVVCTLHLFLSVSFDLQEKKNICGGSKDARSTSQCFFDEGSESHTVSLWCDCSSWV